MMEEATPGSVDQNSESLDVATKRGRKEKDGPGQPHTPKKPRKARGKGNQADQFCIYRTSDGRNTAVLAIEYKAPHKLSCNELVTGLEAEIQPERDVINKEGESFEFASRSLAAAVVTQLFSYMIGKGIQYGYVCTGQAFVFLHIADDPTEVYYSLSVPNLDVQDDDENKLYLTAVAQVFAFVLRALLAEPPPQSWHRKAESLDLWEVEFIDVLKNIPETVRKFPSPSPYKPQRWRNFRRSPIRTRSRVQKSDGIGRQDEYDDDPPTPTPGRTPGSSEPSTASSQKRRGSARERAKGAKGAKGGQLAGTKKQSIKSRMYCTQQCLLGLLSQGPMDYNCPNISDHGKKHLNVERFLQLVRAQLARDLGADADCQPLYISGSRGALFKIRLSSHGYTLVAKGVEEMDHHLLQHENNVYTRLRSIQGVHIPVCLGIADLILPYYYDCGVYTSFLFLGWAGEPLLRCMDDCDKEQLQKDAIQAISALHRFGVLHRDAELRNIVFDKAKKRLMIVDFERAEIHMRPALQSIDINRRSRKRKGFGGILGTSEDGFDRELQAVGQRFEHYR